MKILILTLLLAVPRAALAAPNCNEVSRGGYGSAGRSPVALKQLVSGLEVPWGIAFLPGTQDFLVTERPGRIRLVKNMTELVKTPVATVKTGESSEGGLLGIALHPEFAANRYFYVYYTIEKNRGNVNRVERYTLSADALSAKPDAIIIDDIPAGTFHNGGRIKFGPDGMLYVGTGDARSPSNSQNMTTPAGKLLRLTPDGKIPADNPKPDNSTFVLGIRNLQAFDWLTPDTLVLADHGPSGELGRSGHDEVSVVQSGGNLGWPTIYGCETKPNLTTPLLTWESAAPPGGGAVYRGSAIPDWKGNFIIGTLGSRHLQRVVLKPGRTAGTYALDSHEVYFEGGAPRGFGRLREVITGPDNELYVTTSNCDSRGSCPSTRDAIYKLVPR